MFNLYPVDMRLAEKQFEDTALPIDVLKRVRQLLELKEFSNPFLYYHTNYLVLWLIAKVFHDGVTLRHNVPLTVAAFELLNALRDKPFMSDLLPEQVHALLLRELIEVALRFATEQMDVSVPGVIVTFLEEVLEALENV